MRTVARALPVRSAGLLGAALLGAALLGAALLGAALLGAGLINAGVASAGQPCSYTINDLQQARSAITTAAPGDVLCFAGVNLADIDLTVARSGTAQAPISLISDGQTIVHQ